MSSARVPAGLAARGRAFWRSTVDVYEMSEHERLVLLEVCRTLDELDVLRAALKEAGPTVLGSKGQPRANPVLGELRQTRASLSRLLAVLDLPVPEEEGGTAPAPHPAVTAKARRAANRRWHPHLVDVEGVR